MTEMITIENAARVPTGEAPDGVGVGHGRDAAPGDLLAHAFLMFRPAPVCDAGPSANVGLSSAWNLTGANMTERAYKVGDVVAWAEVPDGAMVRDAQGWHALRLRGRGIYVGQPGAGEEWLPANPWPDDGRWHWSRVEDATATIVALGLTGDESAEDLQRLAEARLLDEEASVGPSP